MPYSWLLFDADGTLFDYSLAEAKAFEATFRQLSLPFLPEYARLYREINARIWREFEASQISSQQLRVARFERLFAAIPLAVDAQLFSRAYLLNLALGSDLVPGAEQVLRALAPRYHLALITNGLTDVQRPRLERSAICDLFQAVLISDEVGVAKPDPRFFDLLFDQIGRPPKSEVLVVGDGLTSDVQGANAYGLDACWYNPAALPPDPRYPARYEIRTLADLGPILGIPIDC